jgi:hypothetical protein
MTAAEKLYQIIQTLPEDQINEVLNFAEFLHQKQLSSPQAIPPGTLIGLRGIAKQTAIQNMRGLLKTEQPAPTDRDVADMLEERRLDQKDFIGSNLPIYSLTELLNLIKRTNI